MNQIKYTNKCLQVIIHHNNKTFHFKEEEKIKIKQLYKFEFSN